MVLYHFLIILFAVVDMNVNSMVYSVDENIENCNKNTSKDYFDISHLSFTMISDTQTIANGKVKFLTTVDSDFRFGIIGERYDRGEWILMFQRKFRDFCHHIMNPIELYEIIVLFFIHSVTYSFHSWYFEAQKILKGKDCPFEEGYEIVLKNKTIEFKNLVLPPDWHGRWRITSYGSLSKKPGYYSCYHFFGNLYDV